MEEGGTIIERIARFVMRIEGGEEVEKVIKVTSAEMLKYARHLQETKAQMVELSRAFREMGISISTTQLQNLPQATRFLVQYGRAMEALPENLNEVSAGEWAMSQAGQEAAIATGLVTESQIRAAGAADTLKAKFWDLNAAARALLRVWVSFQILLQTLRIFQDMADASARLQRELWGLRAVVTGLSETIEGGAGTWDEWLGRIERLRAVLPGISMVEIVDSLKGLTATLGPLGLTADEIEKVTRLVGQMSIVFGRDMPSYTQTFVSALGGALRNVKDFGVDLRDSNQAMKDYATGLGFVWDELNAGQREWIRLGYFIQESTRLTGLLTQAEDEEWLQLEELRKKRQDILAQSPELIELQIVWAELLLKTAQAAERLSGALAASEEWRDAFETIAFALGSVVRALTGGELHTREFGRALEWVGTLKEPWQEMGEGIEDFDETVKENVESLETLGDTAEELGDRISGALKQAQSALQSWIQAQADAWRNLQRRLADIAQNLERRLADLETAYERRRDELIRSFEERRADIRQDAAEREEELREDLNKRLRRMEEDHQRDMQELREDYLLDLEEAARSRDAISMRRIQQRYILEKQQREREHQTDRQRAQEDYEEQLEDLREAREEQERELEESLEQQLRELEENYQRQQEEARLNAQRQQEDAREDYRQRLQDLERNFQERLASIIQNLIYEEQEFEDAYGSLRTFLDTWYQGDLQIMQGWLNERLRILQEAGLIEARPPIEVRWPPPGPRPGTPMAMGGFGLATRPTQVVVGERGPEYFAAWPAGMRMPSQAIDIRLTIDGTQQGLWSGDFETQVVRVLHGVLREVGL